MFSGVFRLAKKLHSTRVLSFLSEHLYCMRWFSLVEMRGDNDSAADAASRYECANSSILLHVMVQ